MHYATCSFCKGSVDLRLFSHKVPYYTRTFRADLNVVSIVRIFNSMYTVLCF
jgi:hypothetical protein